MLGNRSFQNVITEKYYHLFLWMYILAKLLRNLTSSLRIPIHLNPHLVLSCRHNHLQTEKLLALELFHISQPNKCKRFYWCNEILGAKDQREASRYCEKNPSLEHQNMTEEVRVIQYIHFSSIPIENRKLVGNVICLNGFKDSHLTLTRRLLILTWLISPTRVSTERLNVSYFPSSFPSKSQSIPSKPTKF